MVSGSGFTGASAVSFGPAPAAGFTVDSDSQLTATVPAGSAGTVDVTVTTPGGTSTATSADQFTFLAAPAVTAVTPGAGPVKGNSKVTITGSGFSGASAVSFGGVAAARFTVVSGTQITAWTPAQPAGAVDVTVAGPGGASALVTADQFRYAPVPVISQVTPAAGAENGGTAVTITGSGFTGASAVTFGAVPAAGFSVRSDTQIIATSPAQPAGAVDVSVSTPGGVTRLVAGDKFSYVPGPAVTKVAPGSGGTQGGTAVTITGSSFSGASAVMFGTVPAASFSVVSGTQITAVSPAHAKGTVGIAVTAPGGTSGSVTADRFTYVAPPKVTGVSPASGTTQGGTSVTITGTSLSGATAVMFGTAAAASFTVVSATQITVVSPAHAKGTVNVSVTTPAGTSAGVTADHFVYQAAAIRAAAARPGAPQ